MSDVEGPAPLVSVVLPTRNRGSLLRRAIYSVLGQTHANLELIVVDDASTDDTAAVVSAISDPRIRYLRQPAQRYAAAARNVGIQAARGRLVSFQDDDDQWTVEKLERQVWALERAPPDTGLCLCSHVRVTPSGCYYIGGAESFRRMNFAQGASSAFALIATPGWLVRRAALEQAGLFDERLRSWEDWELALRLSLTCGTTFVDEPLFIQDRLRAGTLWSNERVHSQSMQIIVEKHAALWAGARNVRSYHLFLIGRVEAEFGAPAVARRWLMKAIREHHGNWRAWAMLLLSFCGPALTRWARSSNAALRRWLERNRNA